MSVCARSHGEADHEKSRNLLRLCKQDAKKGGEKNKAARCTRHKLAGQSPSRRLLRRAKISLASTHAPAGRQWAEPKRGGSDEIQTWRIGLLPVTDCSLVGVTEASSLPPVFQIRPRRFLACCVSCCITCTEACYAPTWTIQIVSSRWPPSPLAPHTVQGVLTEASPHNAHPYRVKSNCAIYGLHQLQIFST